MKIYMKTTFINIISLVAVVLGLQSCYTDFDPKLQYTHRQRRHTPDRDSHPGN